MAGPSLMLRYDFRAPDFGAPPDALYAAAIEQCAWADTRGFGAVMLSEHHGTEDGYCPSPIVVAAAIAARTSTIRLMLGALIAPFHDPLRLAEDVAVLDIISRGRVACVIGGGYRDEEFAMFGVESRRRGELVERCVETLKAAWTGQPVELGGRRVPRVTPTPFQTPRPSIVLAGSSAAAARRAARVADDFFPTDLALYEVYREERARLGLDPGPSRPVPEGRMPVFIHVTDDPDRAWHDIARYAMHDFNQYAAWTAQGGVAAGYRSLESVDDLRESGLVAVVTPDECVALAHELGNLTFCPIVGGLPPEIGWSSLELFDAKVRPRLG